MSRKIRERLRNDRRAAELATDNIYYLSFVPKTGETFKHSTLLDDPWSVKLNGNPEGKPEFIAAAIKVFETKNSIKSWEELAVRYEVKFFQYS